MHPEIELTHDSQRDRGLGEVETLPELDDYSLVNLTKLSWSQPLVASLRLYIANGGIPTALPRDNGEETITDALYTDDQLKALIDITVLPQTASAESKTIRLDWRGESFLVESASILAMQQFLALDLEINLGNRSRSGAILAVLLTELGWPVKKISKVLAVSRPTLNKWVMIHANEPLSQDEYDILIERIHLDYVPHQDAAATPQVGLALVDVRTEALRTKRSGLTWQKATFLPSAEIADIVRSLWSVSVRVRGDKSSVDDRMCSYALDMFIDILLRRGVTAQNLGRIVGVTHAAVLHRWTRARFSEDLEFTTTPWWISPTEIGDAKEGYIGFDRVSALGPELHRLQLSTSSNIRYPKDFTKDFLLSVHTHKASAINQNPLPNVYVLCGTSQTTELSRSVLDAEVSKDYINDLYKLDECPTGDAVKAMRSLVSKHEDSLRFEPILVSGNDTGRLFSISDLLLRLEGGETRIDQVQMSPLVDPVVMPALFDVDRYSFPGIVDRRRWTNGTVLTEVLLVQAVGQYNRDDKVEGVIRPGFGGISHHWVPAEALGAMIDLYTHEQARDRVEELKKTDRTFDEHHLWETVTRFLPKQALGVIERWVQETDLMETVPPTPTLLWKCLHTPRDIVASYERPKRRLAS